MWFHIGKRDENYVEIYNLSISGGTTEMILERFEAEAKIRWADALIFQTGGNDSAGVGAPGKNLVPLGKFESNLQKIIDRAKNITSNIIFIGFKNCDESKTTPVPWIDYYYTNADIEKYNKVMKNVCLKNNILFIDNFGLLGNEDFDDGLHPNANGHQKIFERVRDSLVEQGWI